ncbi:MAG TPA: dockerin type I domain-containing protein [Ruminococcus flavefaciens]|nr:dockerin type I domain-containing protein [Ruminococcus flavefaciens]HQM00446.1 dockerin type I domain-containing protein [Ruminococcus flavefaciens]
MRKSRRMVSTLTAIVVALTANCACLSVTAANADDTTSVTSVTSENDKQFLGIWEYYKHYAGDTEFPMWDHYVYVIHEGGVGYVYEYGENGINEESLIKMLPIEWAGSGSKLTVTTHYNSPLTADPTYTYTLINDELVNKFDYNNIEYTECWRRYDLNSSKTTTPSKAPSTPVVVEVGDFTGDGIIDGRDASDVLTLYAKSSAEGSDITPEQLEAYDVNKDSIVDGRDATAILSFYAKTSAGYKGTLEDFMKSEG